LDEKTAKLKQHTTGYWGCSCRQRYQHERQPAGSGDGGNGDGRCLSLSRAGFWVKLAHWSRRQRWLQLQTVRGSPGPGGVPPSVLPMEKRRSPGHTPWRRGAIACGLLSNLAAILRQINGKT